MGSSEHPEIVRFAYQVWVISRIPKYQEAGPTDDNIGKLDLFDKLRTRL